MGKRVAVDFSAGAPTASEDDPTLALSLSISKMVSEAREQGIRDGLTAAGRSDVVAMVDRTQVELVRLRESEAKAWGLVERLTVALRASDAAYDNRDDNGGNVEEFTEFLNAIEAGEVALAARKAGQ